MFFLVRKAFWLVLVLAMVPFFAGKDQAGGFNVDPVAAFMAAQATVSDLTGFCGRNPQTCETGGEAIAAIGANARDGAKLVYQYFDGAEAGSGTEGPAQVVPPAPGDITNSIPATDGTSGGELTIPSWHLPAPEIAQQNSSVPETSFGPVPRPNPRSVPRV